MTKNELPEKPENKLLNIAAATAVGLGTMFLPKMPTAQAAIDQNLSNLNGNEQIQAQNSQEISAPEYVRQGRQRISNLVQNEDFYNIITNRFGERILDSGKYARLIIDPNLTIEEVKQDIDNVIKNSITQMQPGQTKVILIAFPGKGIDGVVIRIMHDGSPQVMQISKEFPGLTRTLSNY